MAACGWPAGLRPRQRKKKDRKISGVWRGNLGRRDVPPPPRHGHRGCPADATGVGRGGGLWPLLLVLLLRGRLLLLVAAVHLLLRGRLLPVAVRLLRVAVLRVRVSRRLLTVLPVAAVLLVPVRRRRLSVVAVAIRGWGLVLARVGSVLLLRGGSLLRWRALGRRRGFRVLPLLRVLVLLSTRGRSGERVVSLGAGSEGGGWEK